MKEIMVIKDEQAIDEWNRTIAQFIDVDNKIYKAEFIKVPETFEELKDLCKKLNLVVSKNINMEKDNEYIVCCWLNFYEDGDILDSDGYAIAENRTPQQMWQIIKNLIGEE